MKYRNRFFTLIVLMLILTILSLTTVACWGDVGYTVSVINNTNQSITVFFGEHPGSYMTRLGNIEPSKEIRQETIYYDRYSIEAKNTQGEVVYSKEFTFEEMEEMDWKVVIPPSGNQ